MCARRHCSHCICSKLHHPWLDPLCTLTQSWVLNNAAFHLCSHLQSDSVCRTCASGKYSSTSAATGECLLCPSGSYQSATGKTHCEVCPDGEFQPTPGQQRCRTCAAHYIRVNDPSDTMFVNNADECVLCETGTYSDGSNTACIKCTAGRYQSDNACLDCDNNDYAAEDGMGFCPTCLTGSIHVNHVKCELCAAGKYQDQDVTTRCNDCEAGRFSAEGASECGDCGLGTVSAGPGTCALRPTRATWPGGCCGCSCVCVVLDNRKYLCDIGAPMVRFSA